jgi:hypothetical protein
VDHNSGQPGSAPAGTLPRSALPGAISGWIRVGTLDAELAALASILIESGLPLVVAAGSEARAAGWAGGEVRESFGRILLTCALPPGAGVRTAAPVTVDAGSLEAVLARMPILSLDAADELGARVAIVVVLGVDEREDAWRVNAAHLLRPPLRDGHGHLQRQGPAVLATWDPALRRFEHFAWAVLPELAALIDRRAGDLDADVNARTDLLAGLVAHGIDAPGAVRLAIEAARVAADATPHRH